MKPQAREDGLLVRDLGGEVIVYDLDQHAAHCLNPSAAAVFKRCDGSQTVTELVRGLREELGPEVDEQWVGVALGGLADAKLLGDSPLPPQPGRRELLRRAGLGAALLLPAIVSTVAPTPAEAANTCIPQASCTSTPQPCYINSAPLDCPDCSCSGSGTCFCP
jgi:hypothetical protein